MSTESLLREILQEIREVKAYVIPAPETRYSVVSPAGSGLSAKNMLSKVASASPSERERVKSLLLPASTDDLVYNESLDAFISRDGSVYPSVVDEHTFNPIPNLDRRIGTIRLGVRRENATPADFEICPEDGPSTGGGLNANRNRRLMCRMSKEEVTSLSAQNKMRRAKLKKLASEERKASRPPEEQARIDARVAAMQAARASKKASAGGSPFAEEEAEERQTRKHKNRRNRTRKYQK